MKDEVRSIRRQMRIMADGLAIAEEAYVALSEALVAHLVLSGDMTAEEAERFHELSHPTQAKPADHATSNPHSGNGV